LDKSTSGRLRYFSPVQYDPSSSVRLDSHQILKPLIFYGKSTSGRLRYCSLIHYAF